MRALSGGFGERTVSSRIGSAASSLSNDKQLQEKLEDVVGLYLSPPENAIVFSCDEKSQIQALDRTQPGLPIKPGRNATMTHDYKRNGTTTLFAAPIHLDKVSARYSRKSHTRSANT